MPPAVGVHHRQPAAVAPAAPALGFSVLEGNRQAYGTGIALASSSRPCSRGTLVALRQTLFELLAMGAVTD